jgi:NADP-dependent 3-hydroxy acid dehydrogenase YdfG
MESHMTSLRKIAVVIGASSGIAAIHAHRLAVRGGGFALVARRFERIEVFAARTSATHVTRVEKVVANNRLSVS